MKSATIDDAARTPIIRIQDVNKWYGHAHVLKDISLSLYKGERAVVCGPSGSGKSTLIRCLDGLITIDSGSITVAGLRLDTAKNLRANHRAIGMVFQQFNLFPHLSVLQNLTLAPLHVLGLDASAARERAMHYLVKVRMAEHARRYPNQLSGGEQQRVAIARALCMEPQVMLFDEPTSALDPEMVNEVLETMLGLAGTGMTMVCVTHEMAFARRIADRIVFMDAGAILEASEPQAFFENPSSDRLKTFLSQIIKH
jgi:ABC-type polar amino acid transport system ATPase subunit